MSVELIDLVDENDQVIGTIERTPEWNKTRHTVFRFVNIYVQLSDGRFVIQQRALHKNGARKFDCSVGGLVPSGMTYAEAAQKELQEELGLDIPINYVTSLRETKPDSNELFAHGQIFETTSDGPFTNWEEEAERLEFFTAEELDHMTKRFPYLFTGGLLQGWPIYRQIKQSQERIK